MFSYVGTKRNVPWGLIGVAIIWLKPKASDLNLLVIHHFCKITKLKKINNNKKST